MLFYSDYDGSTSRWNIGSHSMNGHHEEHVFPNKDNDDNDEEVNGHDEMPRRSDSPILRPLPSMLIVIISSSLQLFDPACGH